MYIYIYTYTYIYILKVQQLGLTEFSAIGAIRMEIAGWQTREKAAIDGYIYGHVDVQNWVGGQEIPTVRCSI